MNISRQEREPHLWRRCRHGDRRQIIENGATDCHGADRRECHWIRIRVEVLVDWVPLSFLTLELFGVMGSGWKLRSPREGYKHI